MLQDSGLRISLLGIVVLTQVAQVTLPFTGARAESQSQTSKTSSSPTVDTPNNTRSETNDTGNDTPSQAQKDTDGQTPSEAKTIPPSPEKIALIQKLLQITEQKKNAEQRLEVMLTNMEETLPKVLANVIRDRTQLQGDELLEQVTATAQRMVKRYRELLPGRVNIGEITEEISTNLYAKYYTEKELQDLIDFYQTPTGQKAIATLPQLTKEALEQSNAVLLPEITQLLQEIMQEEFGPESPKPSQEK